VSLVAPDAAILARWWEDGTLPSRIRDHANALSAAVQIRYGATRLLLGGDLPVTQGGASVATGWDRVVEHHPTVMESVGFKVPHHGSREALHPRMVAPTGDQRAWVVTPFASSDLPRPADDDGLDQLLRGQSPVHLTALSMSRRLQAAMETGRLLSRSQIDPARSSLRDDGLFGEGDEAVFAGTATGPMDPVWYLAFDGAGAVVDRAAGGAALQVVRREADRPYILDDRLPAFADPPDLEPRE
jgi:hypothetical protein